MYTYTAYGLVVHSAFELPELTAIDGEYSDVVIQRGHIESVPEAAGGTDSPRAQSSSGRYRITYDSYGTFLAEDGTRVLVDPLSEDVIGTKAVRRILRNLLLGMVLHQRGRLVLHASAVSINGGAAIFLGPKGTGKSTTAAAFHRRGYPLLDDDMVSIRFEQNRPIVDPGIPETRLLPDAIEALGLEDTRAYEEDFASEKQYHYFSELPAPASLEQCYLLDSGDTLTVEDISPRDRLMRLIENTFARSQLAGTDAAGQNFEQCSAVVDTTPVQRLVRPMCHEKLPDVVDFVVNDLGDNHSARNL